ncbi:MAG TPA: CoA transferase [Dehalococcoidia bacterium]|nr:CoA transferase [Dehalococcoidia bacterium]
MASAALIGTTTSAPGPRGPLEGLRVLDLTQGAAGPYCTKLLALYGATVIKVERPRTGDLMRFAGPFVNDTPGAERSLAFLDLNSNKLGITLNLACATGRAIALELVRAADVVVESFRPGTLARLGLDYEALCAVKPEVVLASISNFGQTGPYRDLPASEIVLYAMGHEMYGTGQPDAEPASMAPGVNLRFAGQTAAVATIAAVLGRDAHGRGDWIDVSIMECFAASIDRRAISLTAYDYTGEKMVRLASVQAVAIPPMFNICGDGYFHITVGQGPWWDAFVAALDQPFLREPRFAPPLTDPLLKEEFDAFWIPWCMARTKREIVELFQQHGLPVAPVNSIEDLVNDPHLAARGYFRELSHPATGAVRHTGLPWQMQGTPGALWKAAPLLGEDNAAVYGELGYDHEALARLAAVGVI